MRHTKWVLISTASALLGVAATDPIPKLWDRDTPTFRLPLAALGKVPGLISEKEYYALPEVNIKTYPVYSPGA